MVDYSTYDTRKPGNVLDSTYDTHKTENVFDPAWDTHHQGNALDTCGEICPGCFPWVTKPGLREQ